MVKVSEIQSVFNIIQYFFTINQKNEQALKCTIADWVTVFEVFGTMFLGTLI